MNNIYHYLPQKECKQTLALLEKARKTLGIDHYLLLKKILMVGIVIDYLQKMDGSHRWIEYDDLLHRNERLVNLRYSLDEFIEENGLDEDTFFGVDSKEVIKAKSTMIIEHLVREYWSLQYGGYEYYE